MKLLLACLLLPAAPLAAQDFSTSSMRAIAMGETRSLALARSEELAAAAEGVAQLDAAERQLASGFRPSFDFNASLTKQQHSDAASRGYFSAAYNLYSGMRDYVSVKAASARSGAARLDLERARQRLYLSAAQSYLNLLAAQREAGIRADQLAVTARRISELESRAAIGRSRRSEVVAARSQLAQDKAGYLAALSDERLAQQALRFMTGLQEDLAPAEIEARGGAPLTDYLALARSRPDVEARRLAERSYGYLAELQERGALPTLDLAANYFVLRDPMPEPESRWDAGAFLKIPLYTGGALKAGRDAAYAARKAAGLALDLALRQAQSEVRSAYDELDYSLRQERTLAEALVLAEENARYQAEDYKLGLVNNLDVLGSLNTAQQTRLALSQAQARARLALIKLETAAGAEFK
ncbi:MAG: TolC family protein [Elusimicrobiales bacterium]